MTSNHDAIFGAVSLPVNNLQHGEPIKFYLTESTGERLITGSVFYTKSEDLPESIHRTRRPRVRILVANDASTGITTASTGSYITLDRDSHAVKYQYKQMIEQTGATTELEFEGGTLIDGGRGPKTL